ncbi:lipopolysaccharide biosynthesis protein [Polynucleobacter sp. MWH-UH35A]|uniref:lipopolysaccharide biosynthesis protein n=1 Tax=Polynucleobacter sp. MWH-UH35A TaxID=1855619 RepID=UPI001BFD426D|nr:hypothetical protein [Polynucleobacter sp. MWH-UH35A]QWD60430.1 hypothetical protein ICV36_01690 [Polynucleobacter sp. MWH-UH35A]
MLALAMMRAGTTLLSPPEMGKVSLVVATAGFFTLFLINPVGMFINRRLHAWYFSGAAKYYLWRYSLYLVFIAFIAAILVALLNVDNILSIGISLPWLITLVCGSLIINTINQTSIPSLNMLGFSKEFLVLSLATTLASFIGAILLASAIELSAQYWLLGILFGQAIFAFLGSKVLCDKLQTKSLVYAPLGISRQNLNNLFHFAWPVSIAAGLGWAQSQGYRYLMGDQLGLMQLGLFVAGYGISAGIIAAFESILTTYFQPMLYRDANTISASNQAQAWNRYAVVVIPSLLLTAAFVIATSSELTQLLLGPNFQGASNFVIWGALAELSRALVGVYTLIAHIFTRTRMLIIPGLIGAIFSVGLCVILVPTYGGVGAGIGLAVSGFLMLLIFHILFVKNVGGVVCSSKILVAILFSLIMWVVSNLFHYFIENTTWIITIEFLGFMGLIYLSMQYYFLQEHLKMGGA